MEHGDIPELLILDKPKGISSFGLIRELRKKLGVKKMGHAGTLDPLASGLILIGVGKGTKKLAGLVGLDKTYEVDVLLGKVTETGDMEGAVMDEKDANHIAESFVRETLRGMTGVLRLPVPKYSAVKQGGTPLYKKARAGKDFVVPMRDMHVHAMRFHEMYDAEKERHVKLSMDVASGVYVRSVVEELGKRLGVPATTFELRRTKVGEYTLNAVTRLEALSGE